MWSSAGESIWLATALLAKNIPWQAVRKTLMYNTAALIIINVLEKPVNFVVKYKA